jgi:hypothetical protein
LCFAVSAWAIRARGGLLTRFDLAVRRRRRWRQGHPREVSAGDLEGWAETEVVQHRGDIEQLAIELQPTPVTRA